MSDLLKEAIKGLSINVPIYRTEEQDGVLILYLYGGRVVRWPPSTMATDLPSGSGDLVTTSPTLATAGELDLQDPVTTPPDPDVSESAKETSKQPQATSALPVADDLTAIPGIGKATAKALNDAGFHNFRSLINSDDDSILAVPKLNSYALAKIRSYLYVHFL